MNNEELIKKALRIAISTGNISISGLQRKLGIGFAKSANIIDTLVEKGYITECEEFKKRRILITKEQFEELYGEKL